MRKVWAVFDKSKLRWELEFVFVYFQALDFGIEGA